MPARCIAIFKHGRRGQRGAVLLIMLVLLLVGIAAVLINSLTAAAAKNARQRTTSDVLAQAKDALLGRAVSDNNMPGSLPCPDTNDDGSAELLSGNNCPSYIGRLPWRTLQLPELRDGSGEHLWYALSPAFRDDNSAEPLNSNTKGTLLVYGPDGLTLQTQAGYSAVAVIFSPGSPLASQARNTTAQQNDPANYLDIANGRNNASPIGTSNPGPFIAGTQSSTFNDQLLLITTQDLIPLLEERVAGEVKNALNKYHLANGYYPWADDITATADYHANAGLNRGWLPDDASTCCSPTTPNWVLGSPPQWFFDNQWYTLIYYSVMGNGQPSPCNSCTSFMLAVGAQSAQTLFFMPGTPIGTLVRSATTLSDYLEDSQNNDNADDSYITPTSKAKDRDRLYWLSSGGKWNQ